MKPLLFTLVFCSLSAIACAQTKRGAMPAPSTGKTELYPKPGALMDAACMQVAMDSTVAEEQERWPITVRLQTKAFILSTTKKEGLCRAGLMHGAS